MCAQGLPSAGAMSKLNLGLGGWGHSEAKPSSGWGCASTPTISTLRLHTRHQRLAAQPFGALIVPRMKKPFDGQESVGTERRRGLGKLQRLGHPLQQLYSSFNTLLTMPKGGWEIF